MTHEEIRLMDICFYYGLPMMFERGDTYDNIVIKNITIYDTFEDIADLDMRKMSLDMQTNFMTNKDMIETLEKYFPEHKLSKTMENLSANKVQMIFTKGVK